MNSGNKLDDSVDDWMSRNLCTIVESNPVRDAAFLMTQKKIGTIIVMSKSKGFIHKHSDLVGILTDSDIVRKVLAENNSPDKILVSNVMSSPVKTLPFNIPMSEASKFFFENSVKRAPVLKEGVLSGIMTLSDLMYAMMKLEKGYDLKSLFEDISRKGKNSNQIPEPTIASCMKVNVITAKEGSSITDVSKIMQQNKLGAILIVGNDGLLKGIVTDTDLVRYISNPDFDPSTAIIDSIMTRDVTTTTENELIVNVAEIMKTTNLRRMPVMRDDQIIGIISVTDIVNVLFKIDSISKAHNLIDMLYKGNVGNF